jgi:hypothetical protein
MSFNLSLHRLGKETKEQGEYWAVSTSSKSFLLVLTSKLLAAITFKNNFF